MAVMLTGMGSDGMRGASDVVARRRQRHRPGRGDQCGVGNAGCSAHAGICAAVLPLGQIGPKLVRVFSGDRRDAVRDYEYLQKLLKERSGLHAVRATSSIWSKAA